MIHNLPSSLLPPPLMPGGQTLMRTASLNCTYVCLSLPFLHFFLPPLFHRRTRVIIWPRNRGKPARSPLLLARRAPNRRRGERVCVASLDSPGAREAWHKDLTNTHTHVLTRRCTYVRVEIKLSSVSGSNSDLMELAVVTSTKSKVKREEMEVK